MKKELIVGLVAFALALAMVNGASAISSGTTFSTVLFILNILNSFFISLNHYQVMLLFQ